jgi:anti-sigma factor ChrR (cupin superfamily)
MAVERWSVYLKKNNLSKNGRCPKCDEDLNIAGVKWMGHGDRRRKIF